MIQTPSKVWEFESEQIWSKHNPNPSESVLKYIIYPKLSRKIDNPSRIQPIAIPNFTCLTWFHEYRQCTNQKCCQKDGVVQFHTCLFALCMDYAHSARGSLLPKNLLSRHIRIILHSLCISCLQLLNLLTITQMQIYFHGVKDDKLV